VTAPATPSPLEQLAAADPTLAALARLLAIAHRAAEDGVRSRDPPPLPASNLADGLPLLHGAELAVDARRLGELAEQLARAAGPFERLPDPLAVVAASIRQDAAQLDALAAEAGLDPDALALVASLAALPLLRAPGRAAAPLLEPAAGPTWDAGYCPVCAAWPALAEVRGLERQRWLRCGRCTAAWRFSFLRCPMCGTRDHRQLGYLAPRADRESRRAETCDGCHGYLKAVAVLAPLAPEALAAEDLDTVELDLAALERGYGRPTEPGFPLAVRLRPAGA
jgi:FdhE protein